MIRLQRVELMPDGTTDCSVVYMQKSSLISITENKEMSTILESRGQSAQVSTLLYDTGQSKQFIDIIGSPDTIHDLFRDHATTEKKDPKKGLLYG